MTLEITTELPDGLTLGFAGSADREEQAALYDRCFRKTEGMRVIPWRYDGCPHGMTICSVARSAAGELVSSYACAPRQVSHFGDTATAAPVGQVGDVMTHPDFRSKGVFSSLNWAAIAEAQRAGVPFTWGLPNDNSGHLFFGKLGWVLAGHIGPWTFVLRADDGARKVRWSAGRLAAAAVPLVRWQSARRRAQLRQRYPRLQARPLRRFPEAVDAIHAAVAPRFAYMVRRDHAYLNWRFIDAPSGAFRPVGVFSPESELRGWVVTQPPRGDERMGYIVDLCAIDDEAVAASLEAGLALLEQTGASAVRAYAMQHSWWEEQLAWIGFRPPKSGGYKEVGAYIIDADHPLSSAYHTKDWYFTDGDRDDETVRS